MGITFYIFTVHAHSCLPKNLNVIHGSGANGNFQCVGTSPSILLYRYKFSVNNKMLSICSFKIVHVIVVCKVQSCCTGCLAGYSGLFIFAGLNRITIMTSRIFDRMNGHKKRPDGHHTNVLQQLHSSSLEKI